jgi:hypothetical protein
VTGADESASPSNPPKPSTSGRLLYITLAGRFPHAEQSGSTPVSGQELTVDATTGRTYARPWGRPPLSPRLGRGAY